MAEQEAPQQAHAVDPAKALASVRELFESLVPPETMRIEDAFGGVYEVRTRRPARAQILVLREFETALAAAQGVDASAAMSAAADGDVAVAGAALLRMAADESVAEAIARCFGVAYPSVVTAAKERAVELGELGGEEAREATAMDLFELQEQIGALVPFFVRLAGRLLDLVATAVETTAA